MSHEINDLLEDMQETDVPADTFNAPKQSRPSPSTIFVPKTAGMGTSKVEVPKRTSDTVLW